MELYYYIDKNTNEQFGPLSIDELKRRGITPSTLVWKNGMAGWTEAGKVMELSNLFYSSGYNSATTSTSNNKGANRGSSIPEMRPIPKNWFTEAILVTLLCSPIFGVIAIIYANKVEQRYYAGDYDGAVSSAKSAKMWTLIGLFGTLALFLFFIIIAVVLAVFEGNLYQ